MFINCKTYFSFKYGTYSTEELVEAAKELGIISLALTNINSTCDAWDFVQACKANDIKPIVGLEVRNGTQLLYVLLAANNAGFAWINQFLSEHLVEKKAFPQTATSKCFFTDPIDGFVIYPIGVKPPAELLSNEYIGILPGELTRLYRVSPQLVATKYVVRQPVTVQGKVHYNLHRLLRAIANKTVIDKLTDDQVAGKNETFVPLEQLQRLFAHYPGILTTTSQLMDRCSIDMAFGADKNIKEVGASREADRIRLETLAREGLVQRYGNNLVAEARLVKELSIIGQMHFNAYFLITYDMIRYGKSKGYFHVGRGSGANSIVAYCLGITDVDPIELDLYFERFLNPERTSPPDFDIDFSYKDRDDVIDYMFKTHGKDRVALLGTYTTFQYKSIVRELGKVYGLPKEELDVLADADYYNGTARGANFMKKKGLGRIQSIILQYGQLLQDFPSHLSIHAGGILISEYPLANYCAVFLPPKGFPTAQLDMFGAENIGLFKLDVLSQRGLGHIKEGVQLVQQNKGISIDIHQVEDFKKDPKVKEQIRTVNTIGCFYIESPAMRHLLEQLHCDDYLTLVAASSIIRPGVARSGMMKQFVWRFHNPDKFEYLHPKLESIVKGTYGVLVYQEQVIQVGHEWAGLSMSDADLLRRATSTKYRGKKHLSDLKDRFFANCTALGYPPEAVTEVWRQIESFGDFSFCKAHSASFAVESYQSLYLKAHYPMEFAVAVINNFGGFYSRELYFYELMKTGARVHPPCVNNSDHYTNIRGIDVHVGFIHIRGMETAFVEKLLNERAKHGPYQSLYDLVFRTNVTPEQLELLICVGALRFTGRTKKQLLWEAPNVLKKKKYVQAGQYSLFANQDPRSFVLPPLPTYDLEDIYDHVELLGFPIQNPFLLVDDDPAKYLLASEMGKHVGQTVTILGYHITHKRVRTIHGETMSFGTFLDSRMDWIDTVHFPEIHRYCAPKNGFYRIQGKVAEEYGVFTLEVTGIQKIGIKHRYTKLPVLCPTTTNENSISDTLPISPLTPSLSPWSGSKTAG